MRKLPACLLVVPLLIIVNLSGPGCRSAWGDADITPSAYAEWPEAAAAETKPWTRWWWLGSIVDEKGITEQLEQLSAAGFGGVEITPIYGVKGMKDHEIDFLSERWMDVLNHTIREARRLGMGVDMATGTGWPFGGPNISMKQGAKKLVIRKFEAKGGEPFSGQVIGGALQGVVAYSSDGRTVNISNKVSRAGQVDWTPDAGTDWTVYSISMTNTSQMVKRAAPGGIGYVMDHFSKDALKTYLKRFDRAFEKSGGEPVRAFFNDSFEVYGADWTDGFLKEFKSRRGYDLRKHLDSLNGDGPADIVSRVWCDYRETLSDIILDNFTKPWTDWAHSRGSLTRNQAHGSPANLLDLYAAVDIPETESFGPSGFDIPGLRTNMELLGRRGKPDVLAFKMASSAASITGKGRASSESCTWLDEHFRVSLSQVKPEIDNLIAGGINHIVYHGVAYSPPDAAWPGWLFYASVNFGYTGSFWEFMPELNKYIARVQSVTASGTPDRDMLVYWPIYDLWSDTGDGERVQMLSVHRAEQWISGQGGGMLAKNLRESGYSFDFVSDRLLQGLKCEGGSIVSQGNRYRAVVVPMSYRMPVRTLEKLAALAGAGAPVVFERGLPNDVPGLGDLASRRERLAKILDSMMTENKVMIAHDVVSELGKAGIRRETISDSGLEYERVRDGRDYVYFLANPGSEEIDGWYDLAVAGENVLIMDPLTGQTGVAAVRGGGGDGISVYLQMQPGGSTILKVTNGNLKGVDGWKYYESAGEPVDVAGRWKVEFVRGGPELPAGYETDVLKSWTSRTDAELKRFHGTARYTAEFDLPKSDADEWILDPGVVAEAARIRVNGVDAGSMWSIPYRLRVGGLLKPGVNVIEFEVTNLAANRIADMDRRGVEWKIFNEVNFVNCDYGKFDASGWEPVDSGLLGPVRLIPQKGFVPR
ncbi:MAG TPA: glycosyl hydrolase [bacterium]|nr:glycosyl hydrolase [bacterium]